MCQPFQSFIQTRAALLHKIVHNYGRSGRPYFISPRCQEVGTGLTREAEVENTLGEAEVQPDMNVCALTS
jgi:hypothetical protein